MVITRLLGGLGNQMFQYACGRALALRRHTNLGADVSWFGFAHHGWFGKFTLDTARSYKLDAFNAVLRKLNQRELSRFKIISLASKLGIKSKQYFREKHFDFDNAFLGLGDGVYLDGYWQSEKYFADFKDAIRNDFNLRYPLSREAADVHQDIKQAPLSCAIHVRRGDYVQEAKTNKYHGICSLDYYKKAVEHIKERVGEPVFFVFSDDIQWAKENLNFGKMRFVDLLDKENLKDQRELTLMSKCQHQIIANSSFSWWGAWLNQNKDKIVIAPDKWFNNRKINTKDLIPESWVKIKND